MTDALDTLRGEAPAQAKRNTQPGETVLVDFCARTGEDAAHEQEGAHIFTLADGKLACVEPGLNVVDVAVAVEILERDTITEVNDLGALRSGRGMHKLAKRSMSPDALEVMLEHELARPVSGSVKDKRDLKLVDLLTSRVQRSLARRALDVSGISQAAMLDSAVQAA